MDVPLGRRTVVSRNPEPAVLPSIEEIPMTKSIVRHVSASYGRSLAAWRLIALATALTLGLLPAVGWACACGCGVFDVGTGTMMPNGQGGEAFLEFDYMDQNQNWSSTSAANGNNNSDKEIRSEFVVAGFQYMFNREWGVMALLPYTNRDFTTTNNNGNIQTFNSRSIGDIRIMGIYTGFSEDMSTGLIYGVRLPTGSDTATGLDRDTQIGSGSTDLLLGGFHVGKLTEDNRWDWFVNGQLDQPVLKTTGYRPGEEIDAIAGIYFNDWTVANDTIKLVPIAQAKLSWRWRDAGPAADFGDSGYQRLYLSPGMEVDFDRFKIYTDIALPVYTHMNGNQLIAYELFKLVGSIDF
jgi:hypothetical protein